MNVLLSRLAKIEAALSALGKNVLEALQRRDALLIKREKDVDAELQKLRDEIAALKQRR